jgi:dihydrofolate reductase
MALDGVFDSDPKYFEQWFLPYHSDERGENIQRTILGCGALLMGSNTYEMLAPYWSPLKNNEMGLADKMNSVRKFVVSTTLQEAKWNNTQIIRDNFVEEIAKLKREPGDYILIPGSATLVRLLTEENLIDEYQFLLHPVIMGSGKRFFKDGINTMSLQLVETKTLSLGVVLLRYGREMP